MTMRWEKLLGVLAAGGLMMAALALMPPAVGAADAVALPNAAEIQRLGERMYREGLLPSGEPMQAYVSGDIPVEGTSFTCVSCHLRSGLGSIEGEVVTPPTNGRILYQPREPYLKGAQFVPLAHNYAVYMPLRPAYTDQTLAELILAGDDPTGRSVLKVMPRYDLGERDMAILIAYLKNLSDQPSPGVGKDEIRFATVIVEGSDPVAVESMLLPLQFSVDRKNSLANAATRNARVARMGYNMLGDLHGVSFTLARWTLKGPAATWRAQLEEYYRKEPVFALLGGITPDEWEPVHRFCEEQRIPNLMPIVDYPVLSSSDWYTLYPSRGVRQEGEAAAKYLHSMYELFKDQPIVQVVRDDRRGAALAAGFRDTWAATGHAAVTEIVLPADQPLTGERLGRIVQEQQPAALVVWDDARALPALTSLAGRDDRPRLILTSATALGKELWTVPEPLRKVLYLTYPYRLPQEDARFDVAVKKVLAGKSLAAFDQRILRQSYIAGEMLGKALMEMRGEYHRDFFLDTLGMMTDMYFPLYERVSFGPGQRYASKGCYIVQFGAGETPQLERRSEWVIQ